MLDGYLANYLKGLPYLKYLLYIVLVILLIYIYCAKVYYMSPEDLPKPEVKVQGYNHNTLKINNSIFSLGTGAAAAIGFKAGGDVANSTALSPIAKLGIALVACVAYVIIIIIMHSNA